MKIAQLIKVSFIKFYHLNEEFERTNAETDVN